MAGCCPGTVNRPQTATLRVGPELDLAEPAGGSLIFLFVSIYEMLEAEPRMDWRMRRSLLFSAAFIGLVVTVSNHRTGITQPEAVTGLSASALSDTKPRKQILGDDSSPPQKVKVRVYTESNCPACKLFTTQYLSKVLAADGVSL